MRKLAILTVALLAALSAGVLAVTAGSGSSHREAPLSSLDPTADDTDVYAFVAPDAPGSVTLIGNWIPFEDPAGGPNFYRFDDRASYYLNVDNTGDGKYDIRYRFKFKTKVRNPNSFLYALPGVSSINDPKLNLVQTYSVWRERYKRGHLVSNKLLASGLPDGAEQRRAQDVPELRRGRQRRRSSRCRAAARSSPARSTTRSSSTSARPSTPSTSTCRAAWASARATRAAARTTSPATTSTRSPCRCRSPTSPATTRRRLMPRPPNAVVGVWASTYRPVLQVTRQSPVASGATSSASERGQRVSDDHGEGQVSRLGNPLVNEVVIPLGQKDKFNATQPSDDLKNFGKYVLSPELAKVINVAVPGPQRAREQPHGHRAGAAHRHSGPDPDRPGRAPDRHAEDQPRRGAEPAPEPLRRPRR